MAINNNRIIRIKNNTNVDKVWVGQLISANTYYDLNYNELSKWQEDEIVFNDIANGNIIVNKGVDVVDDILNPIEGWDWLIGNNLPVSDIDGKKLAVHASPKPMNNGKTVYAVWAGSGDSTIDGTLGNGDLLVFNFDVGIPSIEKIVKFSPSNGNIWIHEGYISFINAGSGDYFDSFVMAEATQLQTTSNLDLIIDANNNVKYSPSGPGTGTHGFADTTAIQLIPRTYSLDGDWDYDTTNGLVPNTSGTGEYIISIDDRPVHKYFNKIPVIGNSYGYTILTSDETTKLEPHYYIKIVGYNNSNTKWDASIIIEIYREKTLP